MLFLFLELSIIHILKEWALFHLSVWTNDVIFFIELDINTLKMISQNSTDCAFIKYTQYFIFFYLTPQNNFCK